MIYSRIRGGLGNQLFQYSVARSLADSLGVDLGLDIREYNKSSKFKMGLNNFNIRANLNPNNLIKHKKDGKIAYILDGLFGKHKHVYYERFLNFDNQVLLKPDGTYLKGYWQSEKYIINKKNIIDDLQIITPPSKKNLLKKAKIEQCNSVSLHIRRGDYVNNIAHGTCDLLYYQKAIEYYKRKFTKGIEIFAFSDEPEWVENNLKVSSKINYIKHNSSTHNYEDLRLMSYCKHNIIANSSFSWWGAWLNKNPNKVVIAPKKWFANHKLENKDIIPKKWIRI